MALGIKTASKTIDKVMDNKKKKSGDFMNGLKDFVTSPGGILTIVLFVAAMWYTHHATSPKGAK